MIAVKSEIEYRELQPKEVDEELVFAMQSLTRELSATSELPTQDYLLEVANNPNSHYFIAYEGTQPVGKALVNFFPANGTRKAYIDDVVTLGEYRGRGINTQLLNRVEDAATEHGCTIANLTSSNKTQRDAARRQYERRGFAIRDTNFYEKRFFSADR